MSADRQALLTIASKASGVLRWILKHGHMGNHGHNREGTACLECRTLNALQEALEAWGMLPDPVLCEQCGLEVENARRCFAHPTCFKCLPPPEPLPIAKLRNYVTLSVEEMSALSAMAKRLAEHEREDLIGAIMKTSGYTFLNDQGVVELARKLGW